MSNKVDKYDDDNDQESIVDNILFLPLADFLNPIFHRFCFKPNHITLLSTVSTIYSIYCFYNKNHNCYLFYFLGYLFDCMDGRMARKYNQGSTLGMILDLVSDNVTNIPLIGLFFYKSFISKEANKFKKILFLMLMIFLFILTIPFGLNEAIDTFKRTKDDNFFKYKEKIIKDAKYQNTLIGKLFLHINRQAYQFYRLMYPTPLTEKDIPKLKKGLLKIKEFGFGNFNLFVIVLMNLFIE